VTLKKNKWILTRKPTAKECLLGQPDFEANMPKTEPKHLALDWKAGTLPLSYSRLNQSHFNLKNEACKGGVLSNTR
jgi:hypothetical protein